MVVTMRLQRRRAHSVIAELDEAVWQPMSCGDGAHGLRIYDWAAAPIRPLRERGRGHWLLARRSITDPKQIAYDICYGPADASLAELVRVAGSRWAIEECFQTAKNETGLDHYQVRSYTAWYRHITLSMAAAAFLTILRRDAEKRGCVTGCEADTAAPSPPPEGRHAPLISFSVNEIRRLFNRIVDPVRHSPAHIWRWSLWRRMHQARARLCHYARRHHKLRLQY